MIEATDWFSLGIAQLVQLFVVVVVVFLLVEFFGKNRPHLAHALWALVILKSLTPPLIALPTSPFSWLSWTNQTSHPVTSDIQAETAARNSETLAAFSGSPSSNTEPQFFAVPAAVTNLQSWHTETTQPHEASIGWRQLVIVVWLVGLLGSASWLCIRLLRLLGRIKRSTLERSDQRFATAQGLLELLGHELKLPARLRKRVRVKIVDATIGPAVMGYLRPTVLIPSCIVNSISTQQLKLLLAHELIHLKRRDLNWAGLQTLSSIVWWFNPLVHIASRRLSLESERCCDEETLASLQCDPAVYARCLIEILQLKHRLDVLPALPGIRPVEITAKRMERIMRKGTNGFSTRPWWVWPLLCLAAMIALPGVQWLSGQTIDPNLLSPKQSSTVLPMLLAAEDKPKEVGEQKVREYDVGKLIKKIQDEENISRELAIQELKAFFHGAVSSMGMKRTTPLNFELIETETIRATLNEKQHEKVLAEVARLEKFGSKQLVIETRMITIPAESLKEIVLDWKSDSSQMDHDYDQESPNEAASALGKSFRPPFLVAEISSDELTKITNQF